MALEIVKEGTLWPLGANQAGRHSFTPLYDGGAPWSRPQVVMLPDGNILLALTVIYSMDTGADLVFRLVDREFNVLDEWIFPTGEFYFGQFANMTLFRGLDHTVHAIVSDESYDLDRNYYEKESLTTFDCRDSRIRHLSTHDISGLPNGDDFRGTSTQVIRYPEYNLIVVASGRSIWSIRNGQVISHHTRYTGSPGMARHPTDPTLIGESDNGYKDGGYTNHVYRFWFRIDPETGVCSNETDSTEALFDLVHPRLEGSWMMAASGPWDSRPFYLMELDEDDWDYRHGYPLGLIAKNPDGPGEVLIAEGQGSYDGWGHTNWVENPMKVTGENEIFYAHHTYTRKVGTLGDVWGVTWNTGLRAGYVRANEDGTYTWDWFLSSMTHIINPLSGVGDWDFFNFTLGQSIDYDYHDGYVFVILNMLSGTKDYDYPPYEGSDGYAIDFSMTYGFLFKVSDGGPSHIWDYDTDEFRSIGQGTSKAAGRGQLNLKVDNTTWHHEWTTQDDVDNPDAIRYPLKVNIAEDGDPPRWKFVASLTETT